jgi:hypothetical protein
MGRNRIAHADVPWLARFLGKLVLDILPAALASVIGGFLFTQYHFGHLANAASPQPVAVQGAPASAEMVAMVRDEHALIVNYLKAQLAAETSRDRAADAAAARAAAQARAAEDAKLADAVMASQTAVRQIVAAAARPVVHTKPPAVPRAPLVIAQVQPSDIDAAVGDAAPPGRLARDPNSLLAKTLDLKDNVVAATRHVVSMIGDVFASVGDRIGGAMSSGRQFSAAS